MSKDTSLNAIQNPLKFCVIIPTYNNPATLQRVIDEVLLFTNDLIVVNDGSTDQTTEILQGYPNNTVIEYPKNRGKGYALKLGFQKAKAMGFDYAITIDSDGQHFADDLPVFMEALQNESHPVLLIGSRNMEQEGVPKGSSFGNRFSNFWFWVETGIRLSDTQSGYRAYPLKAIPKKYFTTRFEFEIEIIVRSAWKGIKVKNIPIKVHYDLQNRVSHFRPYKDFFRISVLNTILVIIMLLYIKPRDFFRNFKRKNIRKFIKEDILESTDPPIKKSGAIALGVFVGISPFWGFQTALVIFLAVILRLNKVLAFAFSNISIPPMIPVIIFLSLKIGGLFIPGTISLQAIKESPIEAIEASLFQYVLGSFILATATAILFGVGSYLVLSLKAKKDKSPA
jgi:glycosyltransferase involved in cell wall biosynthesis